MNFNKNGDKFGYWGKKDNKNYIIINDTLMGSMKSFGEYSHHSLKFDDSKENFAYQNKKEGKYFVIVKDKRDKHNFDKIKNLSFSSDGKNYIYKGKIKKKWYVVYNGVKSPDYISVSKIYFSEKENFFIYIAVVKDGSVYLVKQ